MSDERPPSLIGRLGSPSVTMRRVLGLLAIVLIAALATLAVALTIRTNRIEKDTARLIAEAPSPAAAEAQAQALTRAFAQPRLAATLADLATHLPSATPLAEATRNRDGSLRIAIDSADPDELRALLAADPWFERFHERAQEERAEGRIRVTLVEAAR